MLIEPGLEGVDGAEGAKLLDEAVAVLRAELAGLIAEEIPGVGQAEKLHGIGMDLRQIGAEAHIIRGRLGADGKIALQPMAQLMGIDRHIAGGAVAVGKDEGHLIGRTQHIAEAHAGDLVGRALHIQHPVADHLVEKRPGLRAQRVIHPVGGTGKLLC